MHLFVDNNMLSIHAPTRGATTWSLCIFWVITFNPRSYKRSDIYVGTESASFSSFNPRSYKRSDIERLVYHLYHITFNPRSYKRSDTVCPIKCLFAWVFQSTLLQEERRYAYAVPSVAKILSIHAPTRGATRSFADIKLEKELFQSTLLQEERLLITYAL